MNYDQFIATKEQLEKDSGIDPIFMPDWLFDFQKHLVEWALKQGCAALCTDCGTGKTPMQLVWAENIVRKTNKPVLLLSPLGVVKQTIREAEKFDIQAERSKDGQFSGSHIVVTNYERLHYFDPNDFSGVVCDEASCLKHFTGATQQGVTEFMRTIPYRLLATATAAPNDFIELGTLSEALGFLGYRDMLSRFFREDVVKDHLGWGRKTYRFKGHSERPFWQWVCSWARTMRRPSDYGFDDGDFILPPMEVRETVVNASRPREGMLFALPARSLKEQRDERRATIKERCNRVAEIANSSDDPLLCWCHLNDEGDMLEKMIPDAVQVAGKHKDDIKEERLAAFATGEARVLVTKPKIASFGLNYQHCSHMTFFPSHSWEQYYQGTRRCYRFGQKKPVIVDIISTEGESAVTANLQRKAEQSDMLFDMLVKHVKEELHINHRINFEKTEEVPRWLSTIVQ